MFAPVSSVLSALGIVYGSGARPRRVPASLPSRRVARTVVALILALGLGACDRTSPAEPWESANLIAGVNVERLFDPATDGEIALVRSGWQGAQPLAAAVQVEFEAVVPVGPGMLRLTVLSHVSRGARHVGALITPPMAAPSSLPVLIYSHGGDSGVDLDEVFAQVGSFGIDPAQVALLVPAFAGESLRFNAAEWSASGPANPWDTDVDNTLDLLETALQHDPALDEDRVAMIGLSRGGAVGLLAAVRDPRIDAVVSFATPTDFLGEFVEDVVRQTLVYGPPDLPGAAALDEQVLGPVRNRTRTTEWARLQFIRRSPIYFVDHLPAVQLHHGTDDEVVPVTETVQLARALAEAGRGQPDVEVHVYDGGDHNPLSMPLAITRTAAFIASVLQGG
jgi:acetyl esterase/lipase